MVEAKGTPASNKNDKSPIQVNSSAELREWCAQQRKFLVAERDAAKTPDAKLIRVGMLRMLNNMESLQVQASTTFVKQPLPTTFPRSFDELNKKSYVPDRSQYVQREMVRYRNRLYS